MVRANQKEALTVQLFRLELSSLVLLQVVETYLNILLVLFDVVLERLPLPWVHLMLVLLLLVIISQILLEILLDVLLVLDLLLLLHRPQIA